MNKANIEDESKDVVETIELVKESNNFIILQEKFKNTFSSIRRFTNDFVVKLVEDDKKKINVYEKVLKRILRLGSKLNKEGEVLEEDLDAYLGEVEKIVNNEPQLMSYVICKSLFLNLFSELDARMGDLISETFIRKPALFRSDDMKISVNELFSFDTLLEFKESLMQDTIESIKRESYVTQFCKLEKLYSVKLCDFNHWSEFVEITQRRNIIMHCDGIVSKQYIKICKENNCHTDEMEVGSQLSIDYDYLIKAIDIIEEVFSKVLHVVWRKQFPHELEQADWTLTQYIYHLLVSENWDIAEIMGEFAYSQMKFHSTINKVYHTINYCIVLKHLDRTDEMKNILDELDFSTMKAEFILAKDVLLGNYNDVYEAMKEINTSSEVFAQNSYLKFPLFKDIRKEEMFMKTYNEIFGIEFKKETLNELAQSK